MNPYILILTIAVSALAFIIFGVLVGFVIGYKRGVDDSFDDAEEILDHAFTQEETA